MAQAELDISSVFQSASDRVSSAIPRASEGPHAVKVASIMAFVANKEAEYSSSKIKSEASASSSSLQAEKSRAFAPLTEELAVRQTAAAECHKHRADSKLDKRAVETPSQPSLSDASSLLHGVFTSTHPSSTPVTTDCEFKKSKAQATFSTAIAIVQAARLDATSSSLSLLAAASASQSRAFESASQAVANASSQLGPSVPPWKSESAALNISSTSSSAFSAASSSASYHFSAAGSSAAWAFRKAEKVASAAMHGAEGILKQAAKECHVELAPRHLADSDLHVRAGSDLLRGGDPSAECLDMPEMVPFFPTSAKLGHVFGITRTRFGAPVSAHMTLVASSPSAATGQITYRGKHRAFAATEDAALKMVYGVVRDSATSDCFIAPTPFSGYRKKIYDEEIVAEEEEVEAKAGKNIATQIITVLDDGDTLATLIPTTDLQGHHFMLTGQPEDTLTSTVTKHVTRTSTVQKVVTVSAEVPESDEKPEVSVKTVRVTVTKTANVTAHPAQSAAEFYLATKTQKYFPLKKGGVVLTASKQVLDHNTTIIVAPEATMHTLDSSCNLRQLKQMVSTLELMDATRLNISHPDYSAVMYHTGLFMDEDPSIGSDLARQLAEFCVLRKMHSNAFEHQICFPTAATKYGHAQSTSSGGAFTKSLKARAASSPTSAPLFCYNPHIAGQETPDCREGKDRSFECKVERCLWKHVSPIQITTVLPALLRDGDDMYVDHFTHTTSIKGKAHWGTTTSTGIYWPLSSTTVMDPQLGIKPVVSRVEPDNVFQLWHWQPAPECHDQDTCFDICRRDALDPHYRHMQKVKMILTWVALALLLLCLILASFFCCRFCWRR